MNEVLGATAAVLLALFGLVAANFLKDHGMSNSLSRRVAATIGSGAFLIMVLWVDAWAAVALSGAMTFLILVLRFAFRRGLRGVRATRARSWAEVSYAMAGTASLAVGWGLLGDKWLAFLPIAFMSWGDNMAGFVRDNLRRSRAGSLGPSPAMLAVSLLAAALYQPYWVGAIGAIVATAAERCRPSAHPLWDDNWLVVAGSLSVMTLLTQLHV